MDNRIRLKEAIDSALQNGVKFVKTKDAHKLFDCKLPYRSLNNMEAGNVVTIDRETVQRIYDVLGVEPNDLFQIETKNKGNENK